MSFLKTYSDSCFILIVCVYCVYCHRQLSIEARVSQDALLIKFVQLYVQLRQVNRLVQRLLAAVELSEGRHVYFPDGFSTRFVLSCLLLTNEEVTMMNFGYLVTQSHLILSG